MVLDCFPNDLSMRCLSRYESFHIIQYLIPTLDTDLDEKWWTHWSKLSYYPIKLFIELAGGWFEYVHTSRTVLSKLLEVHRLAWPTFLTNSFFLSNLLVVYLRTYLTNCFVRKPSSLWVVKDSLQVRPEPGKNYICLILQAKFPWDILGIYRVFNKYCVFSLKYCDFSELRQFCCRAGFLPAWCVYTHWHRGKTEKGQSQEYFKIFGKKHNI